MNESVAWRRSSAERVIGFHVLATNPTDRPSSLVSAELHVTYGFEGVMTTVKVPHASAGVGGVAGGDVDPIGLPARLDANDALSGWLLFRVKDALTAGQGIDRYDVVVRDVHGIEESVQVTLLREVSDDEVP